MKEYLTILLIIIRGCCLLRNSVLLMEIINKLCICIIFSPRCRKIRMQHSVRKSIITPDSHQRQQITISTSGKTVARII